MFASLVVLCSAVIASEFTTIGPISNSHSADEWKSRIIFQVLTDRFARTDGSNSSCNLGDYCGGTYRGLINHLDYIKNLGMTAIWISPIVENSWGAYHGYHATNFYNLNSQFGSESDFKEFISECHKRDIWVMVDVVFNHVAPVGTDYSGIYPFNQYYHYHDRCDINYNDQGSIEYCRVADLPDLNTENDYVKNELISWAKWLLNTYNIDGLRVDTVKHVGKSFWSSLVSAIPNVYMLGEVFDGRVDYLKGYTSIFPQFSYPMYYTLRDVFAYSHSCYEIRNRINEYQNNGIDVSVLGGFIDNHDNPRWLNMNGDWNRMKNALAFNLLYTSIPVLYYGTEQGYTGGADPGCREPLWYSGYNQNHDLYKFVQAATWARNTQVGKYDQHVERYVDDQFYAFSRGSVLVCLTNAGSGASDVNRQVTYLPFNNGDNVRELYTGWTATIGSNGLYVSLKNGHPQIWVKA